MKYMINYKAAWTLQSFPFGYLQVAQLKSFKMMVSNISNISKTNKFIVFVENITKQQVTIKSLDNWKDLVLLYGNSTNSLFRLIEHLVKTVIKGSEIYETSSLIGSVWLAEIFASLLQVKNKEKRSDRLDLNVENVSEIIAKLKKLQGNILNQSKPCTVNFIKSLVFFF